MLDRPPTPAATIKAARQTALDQGLQYVYTGNIYDPGGQATHCPSCGTTVIGRDGYRLTSWRIDSGGSCADCGGRIAGAFEARPGSWGPRRAPVRLGET
jgi:pyruvate formate lyase activating enzyme